MTPTKPKVLKKDAPVHIVVPDTTILWHSDKSLVSNPEFDAFWETNKSMLRMELAIPEVVIGELNFQQSTSAIKVLDKLTKSLKEISDITQTRHSTKIISANVKDQVKAKIDKWIRGKSATVIDTPVDAIDWPNLIHSSIWRIAPFTYDPKTPELEKGFRDALILETMIAIAKKASIENKNVAFLCSDNLLRTSAEGALKSSTNVFCFESLKDFEGYIKLTQEKLTNSFVTGIQHRAKSRFFLKGDSSCLYEKEKIYSQILSKFNKELAPDSVTENALARLTLLALSQPKWVIENTRVWIGSTTFAQLKQPREYHWTTVCTIAKLFREAYEGDEMSIKPASEKILILKVAAKWSSNVKADGRFHDALVNELVQVDRTFTTATAEELNRWGLSKNSSNIT